MSVTTEVPVDQSLLGQVQEILHHLVDRVRVHSEPELEYLHRLVHKLDPNWTPPPASSTSDVVEIPGVGAVSPQQFAAFQTWQAGKAAEQARAEAAATAEGKPWLASDAETPSP